ncbi:UvrD-helicase domain-containing protein [Brachybacterium aquaticum]|uniref:DNA 3'-5' helicase n=1 Tax=Brachybacterium aquaticum TaxID=1432564 RepID=A0A841AGQ5_9MICO|nr:UvrD-helicase domain-containing protein [Brachybacterium aquaticum]MBB5832515.1 superfamily I DNA/RNA helicase/plasmid maintenance system killer protein [Brachybacterium aquaticum]
MSDGIIAISDTFLPTLTTVPRDVAGQVTSTLDTLRTTPESPGLHVEPIQNAKDDRIRSVRVNRQYRVLVFRLNSSGQNVWLVEGIYDHDDAYRKARTLYLRMNPISGTTEIRSDEDAVKTGGGYSEEEVRSRAAALAEKLAAERMLAQQQSGLEAEEEASDAASPGEGEEAAVEEVAPSVPVPSGPFLEYTAQQLIEDLGLDPDLAEEAAQATGEELDALTSRTKGWQGTALLDLATGSTLEEVRASYFTGVIGGSEVGTPSGTEDVLESLSAEKSQASYHLIEDDKALAEVLASGSFAQWRIFLHPEQKTYVDVNTRGPYRVTGGAGTGKTVVLVHRAVRLARKSVEAGHPARIVLTTYTRTLAESLDQQVRTLAPDIARPDALGKPGIHVTGVDRIAYGVITGAQDLAPMASVLGWTARGPKFTRHAREWDIAIDTAAAAGNVRDRSQPHVTAAFLIDEYREVVLPHRVLTEGEYLRVTRSGRGTRLGRAQRREVWAAIAAYRENGKRDAALDWDETSAVAAAILDARAEATGERVADHVLVDEGQDLRPTQWQMLRALVAEGEDDMFIAEDSHQRIYSNPVKLGRYGIAIRGRSRRLKLNYRTTAQNLAFAVSILRGGAFDIAAMEDDDPADEVVHGGERGTFRSARSGPEVTFLPATDLADEIEKVASLLRDWLDEVVKEGGDPSTIGVLTRFNKTRDTLVRALDDRGLRVVSVDRNTTYRGGAPLVMSFHRAKGMEFTHVVLFGVDDSSSIDPSRGAYDDQTREAAELQERSLLYVGATRARDKLAVAWRGRESALWCR